MKRFILNMMRFCIEIVILPIIVIYAFTQRYSRKKEIGLGPEPLINNVYHKLALQSYGYEAETFVISSYFITNKFDIDLSQRYDIKGLFGKCMVFILMLKLSFSYKVLYFYFNGGPLGLTTKYIWRFEPMFYELARVKTVVMPYGGDVHDLTRSTNLYFTHTMSQDYPNHKHRRLLIQGKVDLWTQYADHVISGCDWVDYMYAWDTLMIAHFSIDTSLKSNIQEKKVKQDKVFRVFHAPNHKAIKGTQHLIKAVEALQAEGCSIELVMRQNVPNYVVLETISSVDIVADQFVIGWYAMFALEAMTLQKPVMCYLRSDLEELYIKAGLIEKDEIPIINTDVTNIKANLKWAYDNRELLAGIGERSQEYVKRHHSIEAVGGVFDQINKQMLGDKC